MGYSASRRLQNEGARKAASAIVADVKVRGLSAVLEYTAKLDGVKLNRKSIFASADEIGRAFGSLSPDEKQAMLEMRDRIARFARLQRSMLSSVVQKNADGKTSLAFIPLKRAGIYVPAGAAPLFSSLFMAAIPAKIAGVEEIVACTPPQKDGSANRLILAAMKMCGVTKVLKIGGAQAIASMAYGLGISEPCDIVCGPGNAYVNAAKMQIAGSGMRIDVPAGPSEVLIIADETAEPSFVAADMLAQSEHGADSAGICICLDKKMAGQVADELRRQLAMLPQGNAAWRSIPKWGRIFVAASLGEAIGAANLLAPEHLELMVKDARNVASKVKNAGAVFIGTAESFCDYGMSGGNHILPTGAAARAWGGVGVQTFGKWMYVDELTGKAQGRMAKVTALLARMEGLEAHARAAEKRGKR